MLQAKDLKNKIKSIKSINHITKAMKMVAAAKLKKAQRKREAITPYGNKITSLVHSLYEQLSDVKNPYTNSNHATGKIILVVISSDKGLCGSFNTNIAKAFDKFMVSEDFQEKIPEVITIGKKITTHVKKTKYNLTSEFEDITASPSMEELNPIFKKVIKPFENKEVDEIYVLYTDYINNLKQEIKLEKLLPLKLESSENITDKKINFELDPGAEKIFTFLLPRFVRTKFYSMIVSAVTSEYAVRMSSMEHATEKSSEMLEELVLMLNKIRQEGITLELLDIVSGSEALRNK